MLLSYSADFMVRNRDYNLIHNEINNINRVVINLLSACRLYLDHCVHHLVKIYRDQPEKIEIIRNQKSIEYDSSLGYRVLEALRNYVQHRGFPLQKISYQSNRNENDEISFSINIFLKVSQLKEDNKFKKVILLELEKIGEEIDLKLLIREFISSIGNVHKKVREILKDDIAKNEKIINNCILKFQEETGCRDVLGLGVVIEGEDEEGDRIYIEKNDIFTNFLTLRQQLEQKNRLTGQLSKFFVSNQII